MLVPLVTSSVISTLHLMYRNWSSFTSVKFLNKIPINSILSYDRTAYSEYKNAALVMNGVWTFYDNNHRAAVLFDAVGVRKERTDG